LTAAVEKMNATAGPVSVEFSLPMEGGERWYEARVSAVQDRLLWVSRDMTEHKKEEERRARLEEQLVQAKKLESVGRLAGGIAHDFNNLLTVINGYSSLLLGKVREGDSLQPGLAEINRAGERAASLVSQLLAFSRRQILQPRSLNINRAIAGVQSMLVRLIGEDVELIARLAPSEPAVSVDPHQLEQVIVNLAVNARDAMPQGGRLTIETACETIEGVCPHCCEAVPAGEYVRLSVTDTGAGMSDEVRAHLFEPFFTTKETGRGTGLGLSTVHGIVVQSGGHIDVVSSPGAGAAFHIYFRAVEPDAGPATAGAGEVPSSGGETVLLVEDQADVRKFVATSLRSSGYKVLEAAGMDEAIRVCRQEAGPVHLLLTDVVMPKAGGQDVAVQIQALRPGIKTLFMSGYAEDVAMQRGPAAGQAFIQKPFGPRSLTGKIREVLDAR
jgi:signal transduction histidine kinase